LLTRIFGWRGRWFGREIARKREQPYDQPMRQSVPGRFRDHRCCFHFLSSNCGWLTYKGINAVQREQA
jgi:hypothetical protein